MSELTTPSPFIRSPRFDGCEHSIRFGNRYPFPCIVLVEEDPAETRNRFFDLRLYPLDEAGRDAAAADLKAIESEKRRRRREELRAEVAEGIKRKECRFCRFFPKEKTEIAGIGQHFVCRCKDASSRGNIFANIIFNDHETCGDFSPADEHKKFTKGK